MSTMQDSCITLRVDQNGAEELTPPGQAILVRGTETLTVMSPYLPDDASRPDGRQCKTSVAVRSRRATQDPKGLPDPRGLILAR